MLTDHEIVPPTQEQKLKREQTTEEFLQQVYKISDLIQGGNLTDYEIKNIIKFFGQVDPVLTERIENLHIQIIKKILAKINLKLFRKGQIIFRMNDVTDNAYLILHGRLNFYKNELRENKIHQ